MKSIVKLSKYENEILLLPKEVQLVQTNKLS